MISARMRRPTRVILTVLAAIAVAVSAGACGTQHIDVPKSDPNYASSVQAANLFQQRCAGCHTLSVAAAMGSASNIRTAQAINGPNFNITCVRPAVRVLYAIENGGFSGAYMPANIFVGAQAREVAMFVAKYAGSKAPQEPLSTPCKDQPLGTLPPPPPS